MLSLQYYNSNDVLIIKILQLIYTAHFNFLYRQQMVQPQIPLPILCHHKIYISFLFYYRTLKNICFIFPAHKD